jgi:hypothetical protein
MNKATLVVAAGMLSSLCPGILWAQQKHSIAISSEGVKSRYVQQLALDVDDVPGHQVRVQESQRTFPAESSPTLDGEHIVERWGRGYSNYVAGIGPAWGYVTIITDKGNKIFLEFNGTSETRTNETGSKRGSYNGTSRFIGGTDDSQKFAAIW